MRRHALNSTPETSSGQHLTILRMSHLSKSDRCCDHSRQSAESLHLSCATDWDLLFLGNLSVKLKGEGWTCVARLFDSVVARVVLVFSTPSQACSMSVNDL